MRRGTVRGPQNGQTFSGGLASIAYTGATITDSYATGVVSTGENGAAGGLVGTNQATIARCYATGYTSDGRGGGDAYIGGLVAYNTGSITDSYAMARWTNIRARSAVSSAKYRHDRQQLFHGPGVDHDRLRRGLVGADQNTGGIASSYWDLDTSGIDDPSRGAANHIDDPGITGLTTKQLGSKLPSGFDPSVWGA